MGTQRGHVEVHLSEDCRRAIKVMIPRPRDVAQFLFTHGVVFIHTCMFYSLFFLNLEYSTAVCISSHHRKKISKKKDQRRSLARTEGSELFFSVHSAPPQESGSAHLIGWGL